ncbi:hypothetical protein D9613_011935 [Agrocybe pediades]|uniref:Uncharacterized protein n=1 Tax=Agrocybe pediades TaxID=84607 RepID=A0A8H4QF95_9AGAR|nr:hypothetical protein D9613_011935 [Agrocybe pediades]
MLLSHASTSLVSLHLAPESTPCLGPLRLAVLFYSNATWINNKRKEEFPRINGFANSTVEAEFDIHTASEELVTNLKSFPSTITTYSTELSDVRELEASSNEFKNLKNSADIFYQSKIDGAETRIDAYYSKVDITKSPSKDFSAAAKPKLSLRGLLAIPLRRRQCSPEDSQETCVSVDDDGQSSTGSKPSLPTFHTLFTIQTPSSDSINSPSTNDTAWVEWFALSPVSSATTSEFLGPTAGKSRSDDKKLEDKINPVQQEHAGFGSITSTKVKSWLTRMVVSQMALADPLRLSIVVDIEEKSVVRKRQDVVQTSIDNTLRTAQTMLDNVKYHLQDRQDTLSAAEESVRRTKQSGSTLQKHVKQIFKMNDVLLLQSFTLLPPLLPLKQRPIPHNFLRLLTGVRS